MITKERIVGWLNNGVEYGLTVGTAFVWRNICLAYVGEFRWGDAILWLAKDLHTLLVGLAVAAMLPIGKELGVRAKRILFNRNKKSGS